MAVIKIGSFAGVSPKTPSRYLQDNQAQTALNCPVFNGSLQPLSNVGSSILTLPKAGVPKAIYRYGQDTVADNNYWFHWSSDVDVCRGQISGDVSEWTFFTGDGGPKATYNSFALGSNATYPTESRPLGLPSPSTCSASPDTFIGTDHAATLTLGITQVSQLTTDGILISTTTDDTVEYTTVALTGTITAASVVAAISAALSSTVTAVDTDGTVVITSITTPVATSKLFVKFQTGSVSNTDGTFSEIANPNLSATGTSDTDAYVVITDAEIGSISSGDKLTISTSAGTHVDDVSYAFSGALTSSAFATYLNTQLGTHVEATNYGSSVVLKPDQSGTGAGGSITYVRKASDVVATTLTSSGSESAGPARLYVTQADVDLVENKFIRLTVNGVASFIAIGGTAYASSLTALTAYGVTVETHGAVEPFAVVTTIAVGTSATLAIRGGEYPNTPVYSSRSSAGYSDEDDTLETRVYTYTWVNKEAGFEFESAPAAASTSVDVRVDQTVSISGMSVAPGAEYVATHKRIYRSVSGVFLFVAEVGVAEPNFTDNVKPDALGEVLASMTWTAPPQTLAGLINLPNGLMAGFVGRDIYFCDPYHPHAWPEQYIQTVDYPVVGFGRMDTTLAVLTTGTPYIIQGSHPTNMVVVKSDLEQACVSKRSIVSLGGAVIYAAPDGLMMLSSGGSKIITQSMFTYSQWQTAFKPESIHAYQQDNKYIGFYDTGETQGGFIFDAASGQFILHDIYAEAGYHDLLLDKLFLAYSDRTLKAWERGAPMAYTWKSKKFTMPQAMGFSCAQLEAEAYDMTVKVYVDGALVHTQTVTSREPFRLPSKVGRDWEFQIEGSNEVFSFAVANSMTELANG
jgi:hypothetical protein